MIKEFEFLTELYKYQKIEKMFFTEKYGSNKIFSPMPQIRIVTEDKNMSISTLGKRDDPKTVINTQKNMNEILIEPAQIWETDNIDEETAYSNYSHTTVNVKSSKEIQKNIDYARSLKMRTLKERKERREEKMLADLITKGIIQYDDGNRAYTSIDFNISKENITVNNNFKLYEYFISGCDEIRKTGHAPTEIIISPEMETLIINNSQIKDMIKKNEANMAVLNMKNSINVRDVINIRGLPPILVYFGEYTDEKGETKRYYEIPTGTNKARFSIIAGSVIQMAYGAFINFNINKNGYPIMGEAFSWETIPEDGMRKEMNLYSRPGHYLRNAKAIKTVDVTYE